MTPRPELYTVYSMTALPVVRENVSDKVAEALRAMIVDGRLAAGERINEVHLAASLGVSRTPLREALSGLCAEGALTSAPGRGYTVKALSLFEFEQIYAIRPILDPAALRLAGIPPRARIERLERLNQKLASASDPETFIALDDDWHLALLADCPNQVLMDLIKTFMLRTRRYEIALMREATHVRRGTQDHERILTALREGNLKAACAALKHNLQSGRADIVAWLSAR